MSNNKKTNNNKIVYFEKNRDNIILNKTKKISNYNIDKRLIILIELLKY